MPSFPFLFELWFRFFVFHFYQGTSSPSPSFHFIVCVPKKKGRVNISNWGTAKNRRFRTVLLYSWFSNNSEDVVNVMFMFLSCFLPLRASIDTTQEKGILFCFGGCAAGVRFSPRSRCRWRSRRRCERHARRWEGIA